MIFEGFIIKIFKDEDSKELLGTVRTEVFPEEEQIEDAITAFNGASATIDKQFIKGKLPFSE